jgi:hypothetical protein
MGGYSKLKWLGTLLDGSPEDHQLFNLTGFVNIAFCSRKAYVGEGLVPSRTGFTGDHKGRPYVSSHLAM